jgi:hypothetical protein
MMCVLCIDACVDPSSAQDCNCICDGTTFAENASTPSLSPENYKQHRTVCSLQLGCRKLADRLPRSTSLQIAQSVRSFRATN